MKISKRRRKSALKYNYIVKWKEGKTRFTRTFYSEDEAKEFIQENSLTHE